MIHVSSTQRYMYHIERYMYRFQRYMYRLQCHGYISSFRSEGGRVGVEGTPIVQWLVSLRRRHVVPSSSPAQVHRYIFRQKEDFMIYISHESICISLSTIHVSLSTIHVSVILYDTCIIYNDICIVATIYISLPLIHVSLTMGYCITAIWGTK